MHLAMSQEGIETTFKEIRNNISESNRSLDDLEDAALEYDDESYEERKKEIL